MIQLTRLNGHKLFVNCDLLKYAEASPDTTLTLLTGDKLVVLETCAEVVERATAFHAGVLCMAWPDTANAPSGLIAAGGLRALQRQV